MRSTDPQEDPGSGFEVLVEGMLPSGDEVHVWRLPLERVPGEVARLHEILDDRDRERAARITIERFRRRFVCAHGLLRLILGRALGQDPVTLRFETGLHGKPFLDPASRQASPARAGRGNQSATRVGARDVDPDVRFSLSHCGGVGVLAVTRGREVGVDVERIRANANVNALARRLFRPEETAELAGLAQERRWEAFFRSWTCKEAYVKARGLRLPPLLAQIGVTVDPDTPAAFTRLPPPDDASAAALVGPRAGAKPSADGGPEGWYLEVFIPAPGHVGAVCVEGAASDPRDLCREPRDPFDSRAPAGTPLSVTYLDPPAV